MVFEGELLKHPGGERVWVRLNASDISWQNVKQRKISMDENTQSTPTTPSSAPLPTIPKSHSVTERMATAEEQGLGESLSPKCTKAHSLQLKDISGCEAARGPDKKDPSCFLRIYSYPFCKSLLSKAPDHRRRREVLLGCNKHHTFQQNLQEISQWTDKLKQSLQPVNPKHLLVLINPFGGAGKALETFHLQAVPVLAEASLLYTTLKTEYAGHARKVAQKLELGKWAGIVVVSGDGLMFEVLNGLMDRPDREEALKTPLGIIPAGSGNALASSLLFQAGESYKKSVVQTSCLMVVKRKLGAMDVAVVETKNGQVASLLSVAWGIVADVDIESERYRRLGKSRFSLGTLVRLINLRRYSGTLSFLPIDPSFKSKFSSTSPSTLSSLPSSSLSSSPPSTLSTPTFNDIVISSHSAHSHKDILVTSGVNENICLNNNDATNGHQTNKNNNADKTMKVNIEVDKVTDNCITHDDMNDGDKVRYNKENTNTPCIKMEGDGKVGSIDKVDTQTLNTKFGNTVETTFHRHDLSGDTTTTNYDTNNPNLKTEIVSPNTTTTKPTTCSSTATNVFTPSSLPRIPTPLLTPLSASVPSSWTTLQGEDWVSVLALYQSHLGQDMLVAPLSRIDDACIRLYVIKGNPSRTRMLMYFSAIQDGSINERNDSFSEVITVKAFRIEPSHNEGIMTVDGERVQHGPIQAQKLNSLARIMTF